MNKRKNTLHADDQIYRQALPLTKHRLDVTQISADEEAFALDWLEQLLREGKLQITLEPNFQTAETFQHLYFSSRNQERITGASTLGFGYPMVIFQRDEAFVAAPIFIWQLELALAPGSTNQWVFSHGNGERLRYNREMLQWLSDEQIARKLERLAEREQASPQALLRVCQEIAEALDLSNDSQNAAIMTCPTPEELSQAAAQGVLQWSGMVGLFPPQIPAEPLADNFTLFTEVPTKGHAFGMLPLDPYQATALERILSQKTTIIEGSAGTGKTRLLAHLLTNALSNGARCLVVSENLGALRQAQDHLSRLGLSQLSFLLQDGHSDKSVLLDLLRAIANSDSLPPSFQATEFRAALDKCNRLKAKLDETYRSVRRSIFGPHNWTQTVGRFLRSNRIEGKELLSSQLNPQDFTFDYEEFLKLNDQIKTSHPLYAKVNTLKHPLSDLHPTVFTKKDKTASLAFIESQLKTFTDKANRLHHRYISKINFYTDRLQEHYEQQHEELASRLERLKDKMADYSSRYGMDFDQAGAGALKLRGVFSSKIKSVLEARDQVAQDYLDLVTIFNRNPSFDFQFSTTSEGKNILKVSENLNRFARELQRWREKLPILVQEEVSRLSAKKVNSQLNLAADIEELEYALDLLTKELNDAYLYEQPFENKMLTVPKRQKYLEEIIERLETTRLYLRDFDHFYDWQRNWLLLPENAGKLVRALIKVKPNDWSQAFESWYLNNCLAAASQANLPTEMETLREFVAAHQKLHDLLKSQILHTWHTRREEHFRQMRRSQRELYNLLFGKKNQEAAQQKTLSELLRRGLDAVTNVYPVLLATPQAVAENLPMLAAHFDYVLFDESAYFPMEAAGKSLQLAKKAVIFGDHSQLPKQDERTLLGWAQAQDVPTASLHTCHRWNPGNLLQFVQSGNIDEGAIGQFVIHFEQLDGRYSEEEQTNEEEAQRIIHLLNDIKPTDKRTYPNVGIVCFTVEQRNLIASYLLKIKQKWSPGVEKIQQLERNGLGVFHIDELHGQHFDVLIVSATYGWKDAQGNLTDHAQRLNAPDFTCSLRLLMSRPLKEVYIINSVPASDWRAWLEMPEQPGKFLLANYFAYNEALQNADADRQHAIAQRLKDWVQPPPQAHDATFAEEVALALQPYLGKDKVETQVQEAQFQLPLLIAGTQEKLVLQPEGFFAKTPATDYLWENQQREHLRAHGFQFQPVWSVNWWKNARQEARKLAGAIIKRNTQNQSE